jgi:hypothetical protein
LDLFAGQFFSSVLLSGQCAAYSGIKTMTKQEAKELTLEVWRYLAEHPEIEYKMYLPDSLYEKVKFLECECPLCEMFYAPCARECSGCPLSGEGYYCSDGDQTYDRWCHAKTNKERKEAAEEIVRRTEAWEAE